MTDALTLLEMALDLDGNAPTLDEMPRRTLHDKGIAGPTAAHVIEEVHTPFNLSYLTFTTGSSAFQNIVGVTHAELPARAAVARALFARLGSGPQTPPLRHMVVTYPPLVNVFSAPALQDVGVTWSFLRRSSRDALLLEVCKTQAQVILGESSFLRVALQQALDLGLENDLPKGCVLLTAGTPLDLDLLPIAERFGYSVHDLYGCQEFGWLTLDGVPLRDDIRLIASPRGEAYRELVVGGLPMGDSFIVSETTGHVCDAAGAIITYRRERTYPEYEVIVTHTPCAAAETVQKAARTILRIKGRVVKVDPAVQVGAPETRLRLVPALPDPDANGPDPAVEIAGPVATRMFDDLVSAQMAMQSTTKTDPTWIKRR
ncbi:acyl carrier protein [Roseospira marina]|uniref:Acyl carrier protein n=1 Tax=Roseospira marina TaxID=140057 RepID=A0A5M6ICX9_9PROT|nr:acyl carrier protein [Roseospira marina]KAA5606131.1 acyl carrier protein [Roseospira marina]MBB4314269.1 hypothetical protein [Roseospira marina]MBB5087429.1 hypothetical protein [Roseospira marina]